MGPEAADLWAFHKTTFSREQTRVDIERELSLQTVDDVVDTWACRLGLPHATMLAKALDWVQGDRVCVLQGEIRFEENRCVISYSQIGGEGEGVVDQALWEPEIELPLGRGLAIGGVHKVSTRGEGV